MATTIKIGEEVTVGTTAVEYVIDETYVKLDRPTMYLGIRTNASNSGTIQFDFGVTPAAGQEAVPADKSRLYPGFKPDGKNNLWAKGSAAGQKFTIG